MSSPAPGYADVRDRDGTLYCKNRPGRYGVWVCVCTGTERIEGEEERKPERGTINRLLNIQPFTIQSSTLISSYTTHLHTVASRQLRAGTGPTLWVTGRRTDHRQWRTTDSSSPTFIRHSPLHFDNHLLSNIVNASVHIIHLDV